MVYKEVEHFLKGIERAGYRFSGSIYGPMCDLHYFTEGQRTIIMENRGRVLGLTVYHSSMLAGVDEEMRRIKAHHPEQFKLN